MGQAEDFGALESPDTGLPQDADPGLGNDHPETNPAEQMLQQLQAAGFDTTEFRKHFIPQPEFTRMRQKDRDVVQQAVSAAQQLKAESDFYKQELMQRRQAGTAPQPRDPLDEYLGNPDDDELSEPVKLLKGTARITEEKAVKRAKDELRAELAPLIQPLVQGKYKQEIEETFGQFKEVLGDIYGKEYIGKVWSKVRKAVEDSQYLRTPAQVLNEDFTEDSVRAIAQTKQQKQAARVEAAKRRSMEIPGEMSRPSRSITQADKDTSPKGSLAERVLKNWTARLASEARQARGG